MGLDKEARLSFKRTKEHLASREIVIYYDTGRSLKITYDASPIELGTVLSHILPDGSDRPVAFASKILSVAQRNYS